METVFEASLALEAHLIRDLLERAGIPAYVEGEYLQGAAGELPLGNLVRVRVPRERATEAREVIADWEKAQPATPTPEPASARRRFSWAPFTFVIGAGLGAMVSWIHFNTPFYDDNVDYDDDGRPEERYHYTGQKLASVEYDRNSDGKVDARFMNDSHGLVKEDWLDDDFDGRFEAHGQYTRGQYQTLEFDRDGDGYNEEIWHFRNGVLAETDYLSREKRAVVKRSYFHDGQLASADYDADGDGQFERHVDYDALGDPRT